MSIAVSKCVILHDLQVVNVCLCVGLLVICLPFLLRNSPLENLSFDFCCVHFGLFKLVYLSFFFSSLILSCEFIVGCEKVRC